MKKNSFFWFFTAEWHVFVMWPRIAETRTKSRQVVLPGFIDKYTLFEAVFRLRVGLFVNLFELIGGQVSINLGGTQGAVSEQFLDDPQVGAIIEHMGGEAMA